MSPTGQEKNSVRLDLIRHTYLHYVVEPMVYSRATAMDRLLPLLRPVQDAPLEFQYKSDIVALLAECLIKGIEARTNRAGVNCRDVSGAGAVLSALAAASPRRPFGAL